MNKKIISFLLAVLLSLTTTITVIAQTNTEYRMKNILEQLQVTTSADLKNSLGRFSDVGNHWSKDSIGMLTHLGIIGGYPDGTFKPNSNIKVDEFIKLTVTAMGYKPGMGDDYWADPVIQIAKEEKLIGNNEFTDYRRPITRQEMAKIIVNALMTKEEAPSSHELALIRSGIRDYLQVTDTHKNSVLISYRMGLISGYPDRTFKPFNNSTRGEASTIIVRFLNPNLRKPAEPDLENVIVVPDFYNNLHVITPHGNQEAFDMTKAMLKAIEKSEGYGSKMYNPENGYIGMGMYENKEAYEYNLINMFASKMHMSLGVETQLSAGYMGSVVVYDADDTKNLHYEVLEELFKVYFENDYQKALGELEKVFNMTVPSGGKYIKTLTFNNRLLRFNKFENSSQFQFFISTKGYRP